MTSSIRDSTIASEREMQLLGNNTTLDQMRVSEDELTKASINL